MTEFEYIVGLQAIVLGLATAKILTTLGDTLKYRSTIAGYWVHSLWCLVAQLNIVGYWYATWRIQSPSTNFGYGEFLVFFSGSIALYLVSSFLSIDTGGSQRVDLEEHFEKVRIPTLLSLLYIYTFFVFFAFLVSPVSEGVGGTGSEIMDIINVTVLPALLILGIAFKGKRIQQAVVVVYALGYVSVEIGQAVASGA